MEVSVDGREKRTEGQALGYSNVGRVGRQGATSQEPGKRRSLKTQENTVAWKL